MAYKNKSKQRATWCRWYHNHKKQARASIRDARNEKIQWLKNLKATLKCNRCPENHPACLTFHHSDPKDKDMEVARAVRQGWSIARIKTEIDKCEVLCANCHAKEHWS